MAPATLNVTEIAAQWRTARRIYPTYSALTRSFEFGVGQCRELESPINRSEPEVMARVNNWLSAKRDAVAASGETKGTKVPEPRVVKAKDAPIREVAPKPKAAEKPKTVVQPAAGSSLEHFLKRIAEKLISGPTAATSVSIVMLGTTKLMLASWEVAAFVRGGDDVSDTLQRAVAARAMLQIAVEGKRLISSLDVKVPIGVAHGEAAVMQERIAEAKDKKNIDGAVNMASTAKRLLAMIDEAEKS